MAVAAQPPTTECTNSNDRLTRISVVITVLNMEKTIGECIKSILTANYPRDAFEVIVIDGGSTDSTLARLSAFGDVRTLQDPGGTIGSGRNAGILQATGQVIAITDGDIRVDRDWLHEMGCEFRNPTVGAVGGPIFPDPTSPMFAQFVGLLPEESLSGVPKGKVRHDMIYTRNAAYRRKALDEVGLFNEALVAAEDPELNWRIESAGYDLVFSPKMIVYHSHRSTPASFILQHFRNGTGCGQLVKINPKVGHARLWLTSAAGFTLEVCLLIAYALSRLNLLLYPLTAMALAYLLYSAYHVVPVYRQTRSPKTLIIVLLLTMVSLPSWAVGVLYGLTKRIRSENGPS
jgi:glycosyltransferase involved in cell wall biosynthesis